MIARDTVVGTNLEERLQFETMLSDQSSGFVKVEPSEVDREIDNAQRRVCECLGLDLAALWQLSPDELVDVDIDLATPVVESIGAEADSRFTGTIDRVTIEVR